MHGAYEKIVHIHYMGIQTSVPYHLVIEARVYMQKIPTRPNLYSGLKRK